jgi:hypothetical protein
LFEKSQAKDFTVREREREEIGPMTESSRGLRRHSMDISKDKKN